jgi:hypothetical protein
MKSVGAWAVPGVLWLLLGAAKAAHPGPFSSYMATQFSLRSEAADSAAWTAIVAELALGAALLSFGYWGRKARIWIAVAAVGAAVLPMIFILFESPKTGCGCFGAIAEAGRWQRLLVSSVFAYFSLGLFRFVKVEAASA